MEKIKHFESIRKILLRSTLSITLLTAPILSTSCSNAEDDTRSNDAIIELEQIRDIKHKLSNEYKNNPELIYDKEFFSQLRNIFVFEEYIGYSERERKSIKAFDSGIMEEIEQKFLDIISDIELENRIETSDQFLELMFKVKEAFHDSMGRDDLYDRDHPNIVDPIYESAFQCRSGSEFILNLMSRYSESLRGFRLVRIHTNGHRIPGFVDQENNLYGVESTARGKAVIEFGNIEDINIPIVVTDYRYDLASQIISTVDENDIYLKNNPSDVHADTKINYSDLDQGAWTGVHPGRGFGYANVPKGRRNLPEMNFIPASSYRKAYNFYADQDSTESQMGISPEMAEALNIYNIKFQVELNNFWNIHVDLVNNPPASSSEFESKARGLIREIDDYLDRSGAEDAYKIIESELRKEGKRLSIRSPYRIRDSILHNLTIRLNRY